MRSGGGISKVICDNDGGTFECPRGIDGTSLHGTQMSSQRESFDSKCESGTGGSPGESEIDLGSVLTECQNVRDAHGGRERVGIMSQRDLSVGGVLFEIDRRVGTQEFAQIADQLDQFGFDFAATDDERAGDFEFVLGEEGAANPVVCLDDVGAGLFSFASSARHGRTRLLLASVRQPMWMALS